MSLDRLIYKIKRTFVLAGAGSQYSPDAFAPGSSFFAASALCNIAVYDNKPHRLLSKLSINFNKLGNLFFKSSNPFIALFQLSFEFRDVLDIELFFFRGRFSSLSHLLWLLSGERGPPLEKKRYFQLVLRP